MNTEAMLERNRSIAPHQVKGDLHIDLIKALSDDESFTSSVTSQSKGKKTDLTYGLSTPNQEPSSLKNVTSAQAKPI